MKIYTKRVVFTCKSSRAILHNCNIWFVRHFKGHLIWLDLLLKAKQQIRVDNNEDRLVSQVALQYTRLMVLNLTNNINKFKYNKCVVSLISTEIASWLHVLRIVLLAIFFCSEWFACLQSFVSECFNQFVHDANVLSGSLLLCVLKYRLFANVCIWSYFQTLDKNVFVSWCWLAFMGSYCCYTIIIERWRCEHSSKLTVI